nr:hypothetical protein [uncultured archaeon]
MAIPNPQEQKEKIREEALEKRDSLKKEQVREYSEQIKKRLFVVDAFSKSRIVLFYASFGNEVRTHEMIAESLLSKKILLPKMVQQEIVPSLILTMENLILNDRGILEPIEALPVRLSNIDAVIVPGIAFDTQGHRLGFGKGYYDKFLKKVPRAVKIGLAFDFQVVDGIPFEAHDIGMDYVVTPTQVFKRG